MSEQSFPQDSLPKREDSSKPTRRDFLTLTATTVGAFGLGAAIWPFVNSMNPAADVLAMASIDIDLKDVNQGQTKTFLWRGKPVFIRHRTKVEIDAVDQTSLRSLKDPQTDKERFAKNQDWLVVVGVCTHLGCVPGEKKDMAPEIKEGGWLCACHGSKYDISGRIISGPAPKNLEVPPYEFINSGKTLRIG